MFILLTKDFWIFSITVDGEYLTMKNIGKVFAS